MYNCNDLNACDVKREQSFTLCLYTNPETDLFNFQVSFPLLFSMMFPLHENTGIDCLPRINVRHIPIENSTLITRPPTSTNCFASHLGLSPCQHKTNTTIERERK